MATPTNAPGVLDLTDLLKSIKPSLHSTIYVFSTFPYHTPPPAELLTSSSTIMTFREQEGLTVITPLEIAQEHNPDYVFPCKMITLEVQSSLEAVGFMAVVSRALAEGGIGCNPVSGYFHDHCFVPADKGEAALEILKGLAGSRGEVGRKEA